MKDGIKEMLSACSKINFGDVDLTEDQKAFCHDWNKESILFYKSLPESTQTDALLFLIQYAKTSFEKLDFLRMYYVPAWSIIFWLSQAGSAGKGLAPTDIKNAKAAHYMAMLLHALDDHLTDHQLPVNHLTLLLRSQAWMIMNHALSSLAGEIDGGPRLVQRFIDDYYITIRSTETIESLDRYCEHFRKQMATWLIVPALMAKKITADPGFSDAVKTAYGSFGIAWRLLDDIKDIESDMINGVKSSIYICLPEDIRGCLNRNSEGKNRAENAGDVESALLYIQQNKIIGNIKQRICRELESAASIADKYEITGLANELRCLNRPLANRQGYL